ncbi:ATP-binding protein, partial [Actinoalloteichus caeruleus]
MRLVERDEQLRCLSDVLAESAAGRGAVVSLEAPASCGRTALLDAFTRRAREHGALVLTATCSATEQD